MTRENERLRTELRARVEELRGCHERIVETVAAARKRIERNLHDGTQQRLVSVAISLGLLDAKLPSDPDAAKPIVREARQVLTVAMKELRELSHGLYPSILVQGDLSAALQELCDRMTLPLDLKISVDREPSPDVGAAVYFAVSEALTNVAKHADARAVRVTVHGTEQQLIFEVRDDGIGGATTAPGTGVPGMMDRIEALGGRLTVVSPAGDGTTVRGEIPAGSPPRSATVP